MVHLQPTVSLTYPPTIGPRTGPTKGLIKKIATPTTCSKPGFQTYELARSTTWEFTSVIVPAPRVAGGEAAIPERNRRTKNPPIFCTRATPIWRMIKTAMKGMYKLFRPYSSDNGAAKSGPAAVISNVYSKETCRNQ